MGDGITALARETAVLMEWAGGVPDHSRRSVTVLLLPGLHTATIRTATTELWSNDDGHTNARLVVPSGLLGGFLITSVAVQAHHAVAGVYDLKKEVVLEGRLKKLNFTNPHASIQFSVPDKKIKGKATILPARNGNPAGFIRSLQLGDRTILPFFGDGTD